MRTITRFTPTLGDRRWQESVVFACYLCGSSYQLEPGDRYELAPRQDAINAPDRGRVYAHCPVCGVHNTAERPILDEPTTQEHLRRSYNWPAIVTDGNDVTRDHVDAGRYPDET